MLYVGWIQQDIVMGSYELSGSIKDGELSDQ